MLRYCVTRCVFVISLPYLVIKVNKAILLELNGLLHVQTAINDFYPISESV